MYIAIEGVKGVGKTTVINHLPQMLRDLWSDNYIEVLTKSYPTYDRYTSARIAI